MLTSRSELIAAWAVAGAILTAVATLSLLPARSDAGLAGVVDAGVRSPATMVCHLGPELSGDDRAADMEKLAFDERAVFSPLNHC